MRSGHLEHLAKTARQSLHDHHQHHHAAQHQHDGLDHICPDHGLDAADDGVERHEAASDHHTPGAVQAGDFLNQKRQKVQNGADAHQLREDECGRAIDAHAGPVAHFQIFIRGGQRIAPEDRNEKHHGDDGCQRQHEIGQIAQPGRLEAVCRIGQEGDTADGGADQTEPDHPAGKLPAAQKILFSRGVAAGEVEPDGEHTQQVDDQCGHIDQGKFHAQANPSGVSCCCSVCAGCAA